MSVLVRHVGDPARVFNDTGNAAVMLIDRP